MCKHFKNKIIFPPWYNIHSKFDATNSKAPLILFQNNSHPCMHKSLQNMLISSDTMFTANQITAFNKK